MAEINSASRLNAVSRDKKSASVRHADVPTNFSSIDPDKKSAVPRQKIGWCAAWRRPLCAQNILIGFIAKTSLFKFFSNAVFVSRDLSSFVAPCKFW